MASESMHGIQNPSEVRVDTQPRRERERLCLPHANAPLTPEGRRRLWGVGKNAVTSRNRAAVARAKGRLRGKQPKLSAKQQTELRRMHTTGDYSIADLAELFNIGRATVYRTLRRQATSES